MKKFALAALLTIIASSPAMAFEFDKSKASIGAAYGLSNGGVLSFRGDYDISAEVEKPVFVRLGYDRYSVDYGFSGLAWSYNIFYGGAYYDFNEMFELDAKVHPFAGLGLGFGSVSCSGCAGSSPSAGGLYYIGGIQYDVNEQISAEVSFSAFGGISIGANYHF